MATVRECNQALNEALRLDDGKQAVALARKMLQAAEEICTLVEDRYLSPEEIRSLELAAEEDNLDAAEEDDLYDEDDDDGADDTEELDDYE